MDYKIIEKLKELNPDAYEKNSNLHFKPVPAKGTQQNLTNDQYP